MDNTKWRFDGAPGLNVQPGSLFYQPDEPTGDEATIFYCSTGNLQTCAGLTRWDTPT